MTEGLELTEQGRWGLGVSRTDHAVCLCVGFLNVFSLLNRILANDLDPGELHQLHSE